MIAGRQRVVYAAALGLILIAVAGVGANARAGTATAFVRTDQLGYPAPGSKRAYLLSSAPETGATFSVRVATGGAVVFTAAVGRALGGWSSRFPFVYALDFDRVSAPGEYKLAVSGPAAASSPPFAVGPAASLYAAALRNSLSFYQNERDGPAFIRSALRTAPGHLNDRRARTYLTPAVDQNGAFKRNLVSLPGRIDASGGWWDAGDYLKFVQTESYTVSLMLLGVRDFPGQMGALARASNFTAEARFGLAWLLRMWNDRTRTLYYQVGIGNGNGNVFSDHDIWRLPQADDRFGAHDPRYRYIRHRPVFRAGPPGSRVSPNLAGRDSAASRSAFRCSTAAIPASPSAACERRSTSSPSPTRVHRDRC